MVRVLWRRAIPQIPSAEQHLPAALCALARRRLRGVFNGRFSWDHRSTLGHNNPPGNRGGAFLGRIVSGATVVGHDDDVKVPRGAGAPRTRAASPVAARGWRFRSLRVSRARLHGPNDLLEHKRGEPGDVTNLEWLASRTSTAGTLRALDTYNDLLRATDDPDPTYHVFAAACLFYLGRYRGGGGGFARSNTKLQTRVLFHCAHKRATRRS